MDGGFQNEALSPASQAFLMDCLAGLRAEQKSLSPKWLYDARGSALFEQITTLPEYYPTRTETAILAQNAARLAHQVPRGGVLVELGSGASTKTRILLDQGAHFGAYAPIDISEEFLLDTAALLSARYPDLSIAPIAGDFVSPVKFPELLVDRPKVGFFPGSTIGNLEQEAAATLLWRARNWPGARRFILGVDLVKDPAVLVAAYDDTQGVTAAFIRNILVRMNAELGANFDLSNFRYRAAWDAELARIDMSLISTKAQSVLVAGEQIEFAADEPIHVSASRKYTADSLAALVAAGGWQVAELLTDSQNCFAVAVLEAKTLDAIN